MCLINDLVKINDIYCMQVVNQSGIVLISPWHPPQQTQVMQILFSFISKS